MVGRAQQIQGGSNQAGCLIIETQRVKKTVGEDKDQNALSPLMHKACPSLRPNAAGSAGVLAAIRLEALSLSGAQNARDKLGY